MIAHIKGILDEIYEDRVVIDVGGIGYNVFVSSRDVEMFPDPGSDIKLYTYTCVREDAFILFGFLEREDLYLYKKLITVNGIGPKGAMAILSGMSGAELKYAILSGDHKLLSLTPGIGKKTAERIILDLKDKFDWEISDISSEVRKGSNSGSTTKTGDPVLAEAIDALVALGYNRREAAGAVNETGLSGSDDVETILKEALKHLM